MFANGPAPGSSQCALQAPGPPQPIALGHRPGLAAKYRLPGRPALAARSPLKRQSCCKARPPRPRPRLGRSAFVRANHRPCHPSVRAVPRPKGLAHGSSRATAAQSLQVWQSSVRVYRRAACLATILGDWPAAWLAFRRLIPQVPPPRNPKGGGQSGCAGLRWYRHKSMRRGRSNTHGWQTPTPQAQAAHGRWPPPP